MSFAKKLGSKVFDDILGIDPSGQGLVGSIRDNPIIPAALNFIPGIGPVTAGLIGAGGNLLGGAGLSGALRGGLAGYGGGKFLEGFTGAEGTGLLGRLKAGESAMFGGLPGYGAVSSALGPMGANTLYGGLLGAGISGLGRQQQQGPQIPPEGFYNIPGMGAGAGAPIGQSAFDYARSIAGGMPFEQVVQPGMEFSLEQPMGGPVTGQPQAQVPAAPVTQLFPGIDASIGGYRDPSEILGGGAFDPFDRFRAPEIDPFRDGVRPTEIRGPGGEIIGPLGRLEDVIGDKQDDGVFVGGSRDFREYDPLKDVERFRAPEIDPFRDGVRPTEIFGPGGEIIGPMGRMSDLTPQPQPVAPVVPEQLPLPPELGPVDIGLVDPLMGNRFLDPFADPIRVPPQILPEPIYTQPGIALPIGPSKGLPSLLSLV